MITDDCGPKGLGQTRVSSANVDVEYGFNITLQNQCQLVCFCLFKLRNKNKKWMLMDPIPTVKGNYK